MADQDKLVDTTERRRFILQKRKAGHTLQETVEAAREKWGEERLPNGFDTLYVSKDVTRAIKKARDEIEELALEYRTLEISRLEDLLSSLWPYAQEHTEEVVADNGETVEVTRPPDEKKIDRILAILDRLERLYDIDEAPPMHAKTGDGDTNIFVQVNQEIESQ